MVRITDSSNDPATLPSMIIPASSARPPVPVRAAPAAPSGAISPVAVEPDQQVGGDRRDLPEHEQRDEVVGQDKPQHPHHEQHQEQDEARVFG
jgi:hypothetical protein